MVQDVSLQYVIDTLHLKTNFSSLNECKQYLEVLPKYLHEQGFLEASVDSVFYENDLVKAFVFIGKKYFWKAIKTNEKSIAFLKQNKLSLNEYSGKIITPSNYQFLQKKILKTLENTGYPFAQVQMDSIENNQQFIQAKLLIDKGINYPLDSIYQVGNSVVNASFLYQYLTLKKQSVFSVEQLEKIDQLLAELPYLKQSKPWDLQMLASSYVINMYLQPQKSNQINVLLGFLPANQQLGGKLLLTGEANILLNNTFAKGETIALNWQQLQTASPRLQVLFKQPFFLQSKFGLQFQFELYKRDSAFLNLQAQLGLQYAVNTKQTVSIAIQQFNTNLLAIDTVRIINTKKLPDVSDMQVTNIAVNYALNNTNYKRNPIKGTDCSINFSIGNKRIAKNNSVLAIKEPSFNYQALYDTVVLNSYQLKLQLQVAQYFPIAKQSVFKSALQVAWLQSDRYFRNELFQIGGIKTLRGFDEESILANRFAIFTTEYRYLLGKNAYFSGFADVGITQNAITNLSNQFYGAGIGLSIETKQGLLNINYAAGKRNDLPFNLRQSKIHIGFISIF
ncbi:MAG: BamA/TamA family outer membrane protein [Chitinophagaceae bacterium]